MIKCLFYDWGNYDLDSDYELQVDDIVDYLIKNIPDLELESTDCECQLSDNIIFWFSSSDSTACEKIIKSVEMKIRPNSKMKYHITIEDI